MANPEHVNLVRQGAGAIKEWKQGNPGTVLDLSGAQLVLADLSGADLSGVDLRGADLSMTNLAVAGLIGAKLTEAQLVGTLLLGTDLSRADLIGAKLAFTILWMAKLSGADLSRAVFDAAVLADTDLSQVVGLATVQHSSPSSIGVDTLTASIQGAGNQLTPELAAFFSRAGVPAELLDILPRILSEARYYSCFIAYGMPDQQFAKRLKDDLQTRGVPCWLYDADSTVGRRLWQEISEKRRRADKTVVLCSAGSLVRAGLLKEIEEQIDEDPEKLVPISLDDLWKQPGFKVVRETRDLKPFLLERTYADFANQGYDEALKRLLKGLEREG